MRAMLLVAAFGVLLAAPAAARAQGIMTGLVVDNATEAPLQGARVTLLSERGGRLQTVTTGRDGRFSFTPHPGHYSFRVERLGYVDVSTPRVRVVRDSVELEIRMRDDAVMLAPVTVVARAGRTSPVLAGFYHRLENGFGRYITREQIERRKPGQLSDMLRMLPGVQLRGRRSGIGYDVVFSRSLTRPGGCPVQVFLDGMLVNRPTLATQGRDTLRDNSSPADEAIPIDHLADPSEVEGIEVYPGLAGMPAAFMGPNARCGTVAIWTRER